MKFDYTNNYAHQLEVSQEFQDYWCQYLWKNECIAIGNFSSKKYQYEIGENLQGFEFKYDKVFATTKNLWIETEERTDLNREYVRSGIFRNDNAWMYCIGDYSVLYFFTKKGLRKLHDSNQLALRENNIQTSRGFLLSQELAEKYCAYKIETQQKGTA